MENNYYYQKYVDYNPTYIELLKEAETKAEKKSLIQRITTDLKMQEYPKGPTKEILTHLKTL